MAPRIAGLNAATYNSAPWQKYHERRGAGVSLIFQLSEASTGQRCP